MGKQKKLSALLEQSGERMRIHYPEGWSEAGLNRFSKALFQTAVGETVAAQRLTPFHIHSREIQKLTVTEKEVVGQRAGKIQDFTLAQREAAYTAGQLGSKNARRICVPSYLILRAAKGAGNQRQGIHNGTNFLG